MHFILAGNDDVHKSLNEFEIQRDPTMDYGVELIVYRSSRRPSIHPCVRLFTLSNMNISATSCTIGMKFYLKHHWGGGKASVGFDPDWIRTLVSMATDSSHRVIMGKTTSSHFLECF